MLILARASQDAIVAALGATDADVGPTAPTGLTAVWCMGEESVRALDGVDLVAVWDEPDEGRVVLRTSLRGRLQDARWPLGHDCPAGPTPVRDDVVGLLRPVLGEPTLPALEDWDGVRWAEDLTDLLEDAFDLPTLSPVRRRAVTVVRGRPSEARTAARLAAGVEGVEVTGLDARWTVLRADEPAAQEAVSLTAAATGTRLLGGDVDVPSLRALLRSRTRDDDPLVRLAELLQIPPAALDVLDGAESAPVADVVEPAGFVRALWEEFRAGGRDSFGPRWLQLVVSGVASVLALVSCGLLVLGVAVIATDGAAVDQTGVLASDWMIVPAALFGVVVNAWAAQSLVRRGRLL